MDLLETAYQLREIHRTVKQLYGADFPKRVAEIEPKLRERAKAENTTPTGAAIRLAKETGDARLSLLILAVAVEIPA